MNGGKNFEDTLLEAVYNSIKQEEIVFPQEQTGYLKDNYEWKVLE